MFIVVSVLLARRWWMRKEHEQGTWADHLALIIVPTIALGIVIWKVAEVGHFQILWLKFQQRTGLNPKLSGHPGNSILKDFYHRALGLENTALVWFSLCTLLVTEYRLRRQAEITVALRTAILDVIGLGYLLIIPCLLHAHILKEHYAIHGDNTLKFMVLVAIVPFSLVPLVMLLWLQARNLEWRLERPLLSTNLAQDFPRVSTSVLVTSVLLGTCFRLIPSHADWQGSFARDAQLIKTTDLTLPKLLQATAQGDELYFSPNIELGVDYDELFQLSISKKIVYRVQTVDEISQHPALQAAKTFGQSTHLRLIVDLTQPPHDWQTTDQPILGKELLHNDRFSSWEVQLPTP